MAVPPSGMLTMEQAEGYSGLSRWTLRRWIASGRLKAYKTTPTQQGHVRIHVDDLDRALRRVPAGGGAA